MSHQGSNPCSKKQSSLSICPTATPHRGPQGKTHCPTSQISQTLTLSSDEPSCCNLPPILLSPPPSCVFHSPSLPPSHSHFQLPQLKHPQNCILTAHLTCCVVLNTNAAHTGLWLNMWLCHRPLCPVHANITQHHQNTLHSPNPGVPVPKPGALLTSLSWPTSPAGTDRQSSERINSPPSGSFACSSS